MARLDSPAERAFDDPDDRRRPFVVVPEISTSRPGSLKLKRTANDYYGSCTNPVPIGVQKAMDHERLVRCRQCPGCLRARQYLWMLRAEAEIMNASVGGGRTWFFTGTFREQTDDYEVVSEEVTLFIKRLRKNTGAQLRYMVVFEPHKTGKLHMHALIHEVAGVVSHRHLKRAWRAGWMSANLCDVKTARYLVKYTTKDLFETGDADAPLKYHRVDYGLHVNGEVQEKRKRRPRMRSSHGYGAWVMERDKDLVRELMASRPKERKDEIWKKNLVQLIRESQKDPSPETVLMDLVAEMQCKQPIKQQ